ncbi:chlorophyll a/b-binding protein [Leptolyngbya sp. Heron Island J]|uniref:chlorophyll a/b-binding protein n=1 Tax=Leptolyngbya sp. Heron Island J TaxID=1385935 RepID=UPI0004142B72|nr:chlorophyll a/b-binding protein [Leptolyngbya sp. Heron Island J]
MSKSDSLEPNTSQSPSATPDDQASFGWNIYAERINGRFAMVGFLALLLLEFFTRQDFFTWLGLP